MTVRRWLFAGLFCVGMSAAGSLFSTNPLFNRAEAAPSAPYNPQAAELFQASYDNEALLKLHDALGALDQLPPGLRDGYVARLRRGWLLYRLARYAESITSYEQAIATAPRALEARVGILLPQMALRRWSDAEGQARAALRIDPASYLATLRLAFICYNLGRFPEAVAHYAKLSEAYPSDVEVLSGLGWALLKSGRVDEAARTFRDLLQISPRHALGQEGLKATGR